MKFDFKEIDHARRLLGLSERATLDEIKQAFHRLAKKHHPDGCEDSQKKDCEEKYKEISQAYNLLMFYCRNYRYCFDEQEVIRQSWDEETYQHLKQFYHDWWGKI